MVVLYIVPEKICSSFFYNEVPNPIFSTPFLYSMPLKGIFNVTHLVPLYCNYIKPCRSIGILCAATYCLSASVQSFLLFCIHCFQRTARTFLFAGISLHRIPNTPCPWQSDRSPRLTPVVILRITKSLLF